MSQAGVSRQSLEHGPSPADGRRRTSVAGSRQGRGGRFPPDSERFALHAGDMSERASESLGTVSDVVSDVRIVGVEAERLTRIRERGTDEFGNPWTARPAQGWEPLRCCLTRAVEGEPIALICHTPWPEPSPWMEAGPVFVHFGPCAGYHGEPVRARRRAGVRAHHVHG